MSERQKRDKRLLIQNGFMIDPGSGRAQHLDILVQDGRILRMGDRHTWEDLQADREMQVFDAAGLTVAPGLVDVHVHFRDPGFLYKEDIESGSRAAAKGGFTTVVLMANTRPAVDNAQILAYVLQKGRETGIRVESCCAVTRGQQGRELTDMEELLAAGAAGFTDDGIPLLEEDVARRAMQEAARLGTVLSFHEEDPAYIVNPGIHAGAASAHYGIGGASRQAEITMVERDIRLAGETGATILIQHISTREAVELVRRGKRQGIRVYAEATPHHIALNENAAIRYGTLAKMNPPVREEADRLAIIEGLQDGTIDLIATDHAPHSREEKAKPITEAPSGIIGLETALALGITYLVEPGYLTLMSLLEKMTYNPAGLYGLEQGCLREGGWADMVLFAPSEHFRVDGFVSRSCNSPFLGMELTGKVKGTVCGGRLVYQEQAK